MSDDRDSDVFSREVLFLDASRSEYQSQEALNKEINLKVFGVLAFIITLFTISLEFVSVDSVPLWLMFALFLNFSLCVGLSIFIVRPITWLRPFDPIFIKDTLYNYEPRGIAYGLGEGYAETVESNRDVIKKKSSYLTWLLWSSFAFLLLIVFTIFYESILFFFQMV